MILAQISTNEFRICVFEQKSIINYKYQYFITFDILQLINL